MSDQPTYEELKRRIQELEAAQVDKRHGERIHCLESLERISEALLHTEDIEKVLDNVMEIVLSIFDCDRAWLLYPCNPDAPGWSIPIERTKPEYPGASSEKTHFPMTPDVAETFRELLATDKPISDIVEPDNIQWDLNNRYRIKSFISIAIYPRVGQPWDFGLHQCSYARIWTEAEKNLFKKISLRIGEALSILLILRDLKKSERKFRTYIDNSPMGVFITDETGKCRDVNRTACTMLGYSRQELLKMSIPDLDKAFLSEEGQAEFEELKQSGYVHSEKQLTKKNGSSLEVDLQAVALGKDRYMGYCADITKKKQLEERLQHAQKMESIGTLAGGIAHEFNNILSIIIGNNELIMDDLPQSGEARSSAKEIRIAGLRARDVVKQLLTFSRQDNSAKKNIDLRSVVIESLKLIRSSTPKNIEIQQNLSTDISTIYGNGTQINQMLINLCSNAVDAIQGKSGTITVNLKNEAIEDSKTKPFPDLIPGQYTKLTISDDGQGMNAETLKKVFEPYFTTKKFGEGTGIGLAVVHGIVKRHHGHISAVSRPGKGTKFTVLLPSQKRAVESPKHRECNIPEGSGHILLIDDEPAIALSSKRLLEKLGYTVESETSPTKALEIFKSRPKTFDLLITDMAMPNITGDQLVVEALTIRPDLPTIVCTGYSSYMSKEKADAIGVSALVMKPLDKTDMAHTIRKVMIQG